MKRLFLFFGFIVVLLVIQFITYTILAEKKLPELVIKHLMVNSNCATDTIVFGSTMSIYDNPENPIQPYSLHLSSTENITKLRGKLNTHTLIHEDDYGKYIRSIETQHPNDSEYMNSKIKNKSKLYITAIEERFFFVNVTINWSCQNQFYYNEDRYFWFLFNWIKI